MVRWVIGSILHEVDPLSYFSFQPVLCDWCNKGCSMYYRLWDDAYKRTLAANRKEPMWWQRVSSLAEWFFTICLMPYNRK